MPAARSSVIPRIDQIGERQTVPPTVETCYPKADGPRCGLNQANKSVRSGVAECAVSVACSSSVAYSSDALRAHTPEYAVSILQQGTVPAQSARGTLSVAPVSRDRIPIRTIKGLKMNASLKSDLRQFISSEYLFGDDSRMPADTDSLLETGILDSTGVLELIEFLEEKYAISVDESETVPENLGSIINISRYVTQKIDQMGRS